MHIENRFVCGVTILEFEMFSEEADELLSEQEFDDLRNLLAFNPEVGSKIPHTGGIRKLRIGLERRGKGKRGGARVIYFFHSEGVPLALLAIYAKGEKIDLSMSEKRELKMLVDDYLAGFKEPSS